MEAGQAGLQCGAGELLEASKHNDGVAAGGACPIRGAVSHSWSYVVLGRIEDHVRIKPGATRLGQNDRESARNNMMHKPSLKRRGRGFEQMEIQAGQLS